jgi:capsular polysaccharide export protein
MTRQTVYAVGFYPWKKTVLRTFRPGEKLVFCRSPRHLPQGQPLQIAAWGTLLRDEEFPEGSRITRYEDGFIRSAGLGAKFTPALSWVADRRGIYYDATKPSDLEVILQEESFSDELLARARRLREKIVEAGLTKYNLKGASWRKPDHSGRLILVAGQVESDASIRLGSSDIKTNLDLLERVRRENPDDFIIYKPHPDVAAGVRRAGKSEAEAGNYCNSIVSDAPIHELIAAVDQVHANTSLVGFEALLRGKKVVTYGQPFYAGWGLTEDHHPPPRRKRKLSLNELVAGSLLLYPLYRSAKTGQPCAAEEVVEEISRGASGPRPSALELGLRLLSGTRFWHRFCSQ